MYLHWTLDLGYLLMTKVTWGSADAEATEGKGVDEGKEVNVNQLPRMYACTTIVWIIVIGTLQCYDAPQHGRNEIPHLK